MSTQGEEQIKEIKERLSGDGVNGGIIKSDKFGYYYFFPDEAKDIYFRLENLEIYILDLKNLSIKEVKK